MNSIASFSAVRRKVNKLTLEIWFYNYSTVAKMPASTEYLTKAANQLEIVSEETRSEEMHVGNIHNPRLPYRFIYNWSIRDMNCFACAVSAIPESDYPELRNLLGKMGRASLAQTLMALAGQWPEVVHCGVKCDYRPSRPHKNHVI